MFALRCRALAAAGAALSTSIGPWPPEAKLRRGTPRDVQWNNSGTFTPGVRSAPFVRCMDDEPPIYRAVQCLVDDSKPPAEANLLTIDAAVAKPAQAAPGGPPREIPTPTFTMGTMRAKKTGLLIHVPNSPTANEVEVQASPSIT